MEMNKGTTKWQQKPCLFPSKKAFGPSEISSNVVKLNIAEMN